MALVSPGVSVSVIDESFYTPAEPGTTPIIFVATQENKTNPGSTGTAPGTLKANANKVYLMGSQRELSETFGDPIFYKDSNNNPIHAGEQNEYGLQTAYSFLGVANRAYVVRADIDLAAITGQSSPVEGKATQGAYWFDTNDSLFGIFEWNGSAATTTNGQTFVNKVPTVITDTTKVVDFAGEDYTPKGSVGAIGDYAVVAVTSINRVWYKNVDGAWVEVGSSEWKASQPFVIGGANPSLSAPGTISFTVDGSSLWTVTPTGATLDQVISTINNDANLSANGITAAKRGSALALYYAPLLGDNTEEVIVSGDATLLSELGITAATYYGPKVAIQPHTSVPLYKSRDANPRPTGSVWIKTTTPNLGANLNVKTYSAATDSWSAVSAPMYADGHAAIYALDATGGGQNISTGTVYATYNVGEDTSLLATFKLQRRKSTAATTITSSVISIGSFTSGAQLLDISESINGQATMSTPTTVSFTTTGQITDADAVADAINGAGLGNVTASVNSKNQIVISHAVGGEIRFVDTSEQFDNIFAPFDANVSSTTANLYYVPGTNNASSPKQFLATNWEPLTYTAKDGEPTTTPADGALWYSSVIDEVDLMIHDGTKWVGYHNYDHTGGALIGASSTNDPAGPLVAAAAPTKQSDGSALIEGDIWISTADLENFPKVYRWADATFKWVLLDSSDQTTENGILFDDARWSTTGGIATAHAAGDIADMLISDYVDPDAPDPALYPKGMLLWNLRRSGFNVKRFERNYVDIDALNIRYNNESMAAYYPHRWVTESANNADGSGAFGRTAQRKVVVQAMQAMINSTEDLRDDETRIFNLMAAPGYPELIGEMVSLNYDRGLSAFVVGDSPMRLSPSTTSISNWATNVAKAVEDNDSGLVSRDEYLGVYYPAGFSSDNAGNNIVVPPSHMALRTIALSDQVSYPWFAPAGTRRGGVTNATATGYVNAEGEFVSVALNEGQRDTLYQNNVNPITFLNGAGLVVFGQKTRARNASALDRVNVARLTVYLRSQLKKLAKPYIFEPNDKITRDEIKQQVESLMVELIGLRAIYDYLVVCDDTNNTPNRIDRNELYVDIAIEPVKAVEFIYIPLRLKNTGEIAGL
jgi:hypothetical protein